MVISRLSKIEFIGYLLQVIFALPNILKIDRSILAVTTLVTWLNLELTAESKGGKQTNNADTSDCMSKIKTLNELKPLEMPASDEQFAPYRETSNTLQFHCPCHISTSLKPAQI